MKTAIIYASVHHGNTKKVCKAIAEANEVDLFDAVKEEQVDLAEYDLIGLASGAYYSKFHPVIRTFALEHISEGQKVFLINTCGNKDAFKSMEEIIVANKANVVGKFSCKGFDTYGPFKLVGGIAKGHPDEKDIEDALEFFKQLQNMSVTE